MENMTVRDAALAACGLDYEPLPREFKGAEKEKKVAQLRRVNELQTEFEKAIRTKQLDSSGYKVVGQSDRIDLVEPGPLIAYMKTYHPSWRVTVQLDGEAQRQKPAYRTAAIDLQDRAIEEFWIAYDQARPPKSETIIAWLKKEGATDNIARAIDAIIRPDALKLGGNRKAKGAPQKSVKK